MGCHCKMLHHYQRTSRVFFYHYLCHNNSNQFSTTFWIRGSKGLFCFLFPHFNTKTTCSQEEVGPTIGNWLSTFTLSWDICRQPVSLAYLIMLSVFCACVFCLFVVQMYVIYIWCNKVKFDARLLFEATILYATSKDPVSTNLILIKYHHNEDLHSLRIHLELKLYQVVPWFDNRYDLAKTKQIWTWNSCKCARESRCTVW